METSPIQSVDKVSNLSNKICGTDVIRCHQEKEADTILQTQHSEQDEALTFYL